MDDTTETIEDVKMNNYPPHQDAPRYPHQKRPANQHSSWRNAGWGDEQGQPHPNDPHAPADGYVQYGQQQQYGPYGQYAPPSQQQQPDYGQYGGQGQYGQYGSPSQYGQQQQDWEYGIPASQPQYGSYGQSDKYGAPYQQPSYVPNAVPPPSYSYPAPTQQDYDYDYDDTPPRKSRRGLYTILSIFGAIIAIMVICGVLANIPPPAPKNTASIAGTWYGRTNIAEDSMGTVAGEAYMDLHQTGASVAGTGKVCVNRRSKAFEYIDLKIDGSMSGTNATITWHFENLTNDAKGDAELTGSVTNGTLSLIFQSMNSNITLGAKKGTHEEYLAACRQLPAS